MKKTIIATLCGLLVVGSANAHEARTMSNSDGLKVEVKLLDFEKGDKSIGYVTISESKYGLVFTPELTGLTVGLHGFHLHEKPSCAAGEKDGKKAKDKFKEKIETSKHAFTILVDAFFLNMKTISR